MLITRVKMVSAYLVILVCLGLVPFSVNAAIERVALVMGNSAYKDSPLQNPVNDAEDISRALTALSFDVTTVTNADQRQMMSAIRSFSAKLGEGVVGLFYYAGHGIQINGHNYLLPLNNDIQAADEIQFNAIDVGQILAKMEAADNGLNIIMLDACRNNPFKRSFSRSLGRGLAVVEAPTGSMVVYATAPNNIAGDGAARNGIFTENLLKHINTPDLSLEEVVRLTRADVVAQTNAQQVPWSSSSMTQPFYFSASAAQSTALASTRQPAATSASTDQSSLARFSDDELSTWLAIRESIDANELRAFTQRFPGGLFVDAANARIASLTPNNLALYIETMPSGARVRVLNIGPVYQYGMALPAGSYQIEVSQTDYVTQTDWVTLGEQQSFSFSLDRQSPVLKTAVKTSVNAADSQPQNVDLVMAQQRQAQPPPRPVDSAKASRWYKEVKKALKLESWPEVIRTTTLTLEADPGHIEALLDRSLGYIRLGYFDHADADVEQALALAPRNAVAHNNKGVVLEVNKDLGNAIGQYRYSCDNGFRLACDNFKRLTGYYPQDKSDFFRLKGLAHFNNGDYDLAIENALIAINADSKNHNAYILRAGAYTLSGQAQLGLRDAEMAVSLNPNDGMAFNNLGFAQEKLGQVVDATINYTIACNMGAQISCDNLARIQR